MARFLLLVVNCFGLAVADSCGNLVSNSVGTCRIGNCNAARGHSHCAGLLHKCWCNDGNCPMSGDGSTDSRGLAWCASMLYGHSCRFLSCNPSNSMCYRSKCFCAYGYVASANNNACVRDSSWPTSLVELRTMNATDDTNEQLIAQSMDFQKQSDQMVALNSFGWAVGISSIVMAVIANAAGTMCAAKWYFKKDLSVSHGSQDGYEQLGLPDEQYAQLIEVTE